MGLFRKKPLLLSGVGQPNGPSRKEAEDNLFVSRVRRAHVHSYVHGIEYMQAVKRRRRLAKARERERRRFPPEKRKNYRMATMVRREVEEKRKAIARKPPGT